HELIRQVAYDGTRKAARAELHERLACWLEASDIVPDELLGYHLEQAYRYRSEVGGREDRERRLASRAARYLGRGGSLAFSRGDMPAAVNLLDRATTLMAPDTAERVTLLYTLGAALAEAGELKRAETVPLGAHDAAA